MSAKSDNGLPALAAFISDRIRSFFAKENGFNSRNGLSINFEDEVAPSALTSFSHQHRLPKEEQVLLLLVLAPHLQADFYDHIIQEALPKAGDFPQIGGARGKNFRGFPPTGETALFLLAGEDMEKRRETLQLFSEDHLFAKKRILW